MDFQALIITVLLTLGSIDVSGNTGQLSTTTGDTVLIPCNFGEGTIRNLYWYYNDGKGPAKILTLFKGDVSVDAAYTHRASVHDDSSTLILKDTIVKDEGTYRCDVERERQKDVLNINTKLNVFSLTPDTLPEIVECTDADCIIYSNKSITITCALRNVYPAEDVKLIWYQDGQLVTSPNNLTLNDDGTIDLIRPIQVAESGNFTCNASFLTTQGAENAAVPVGVWITTEPANTPGKKLTSGQTAGTVVCALAVPLLVIALLIVRKRQRKKNKDSNVVETETVIDGGPKEEQSSLIQGLNKTTYSSSLPPVPNPQQESNMDRSGKREITSEEITRLARILPESKFSELFNALKKLQDNIAAAEELLEEWKAKTRKCINVLDEAMKKAELGDIYNMVYDAVVEVLLKLWKANTHGYTDDLDEAMKKAMVGVLIPKYKQELEDRQQSEGPTSSTTMSAAASNGHDGGTVPDERLEILATHVPSGKYTSLSLKLGAEYNEATSILDKHNNDSEKAIRECLNDWKNRTGGSLDDLKEILRGVELGGLVRY